MDIIVSIPASKLAEIEAEEAYVERLRQQGSSVNYFWKIGRAPRRLHIGDRCYFLWENAVRAWHEVVDFGYDMKCIITGTVYPGFSVVLDSEIHEIEPIPMKPFRGFRYFDSSRI